MNTVDGRLQNYEYEMRLMVVVEKKDAILGGEFATVKTRRATQQRRPGDTKPWKV